MKRVKKCLLSYNLIAVLISISHSFIFLTHNRQYWMGYTDRIRTKPAKNHSSETYVFVTSTGSQITQQSIALAVKRVETSSCWNSLSRMMRDRNKVATLENVVAGISSLTLRRRMRSNQSYSDISKRGKKDRRGRRIGDIAVDASDPPGEIGIVLRVAATSSSTMSTSTTTTTTTTMSVATAAAVAAVVVAVLQVGARNKGSLRGRRRWFVSFRVVPEWVRAS